MINRPQDEPRDSLHWVIFKWALTVLVVVGFAVAVGGGFELMQAKIITIVKG